MLLGWGIRRVLGGALGVVIVLSAVTAAWAMRVAPMVAELSTQGAGSVARIEVSNVGNAVLPFETSVTRIEMDDEGNLTETPADEDFLVFPPQGLVPVGGRQVVRVQWVGAPTLDASHAYYLSIRQLPVDMDPTQISEAGGSMTVRMLYNMKALIVVAPPGATPKVEVVSAAPIMIEAAADPEVEGEPAEEPVFQPGVEIVVGNAGKRYALMSGATWIVEGTDKSGQAFRREYGSEDISQLVGVGYLAPLGGKRTFKLPTGGVELDPAKPVSVRFAR